MATRKKAKASALPFPVYFWTVVVLAAGGVTVSIYLSISHYRVYTDIAYKSFCAISKALNCDTVSQSPYSIFMGLPVAVWGIIGYLFVLLFMPLVKSPRAQKERIWSILFFISLSFCVYSIILAVISSFLIHSYCVMCIVSYGINLMLLFEIWIVRRRFSTSGMMAGLMQDFLFLWEKRIKVLWLFMPLILCIFLLFSFMPEYWKFTPPSRAVDIPQGLTKEGHPWIGAEDPELVIVEFTDYQCFQCKKMHFYLRELMEENPEKLRLVHRHYPMDHKFNPTVVPEPFHEGSGEMALLAIYASAKGKFWHMNDLLFDLGTRGRDISIRMIAQETGLDFKELSMSRYHPEVRRRLQRDIWKGMKLRILGTPGFLIEGKVYQGNIPSEIISKALD